MLRICLKVVAGLGLSLSSVPGTLPADHGSDVHDQCTKSQFTPKT